jgi:hypothetical protein
MSRLVLTLPMEIHLVMGRETQLMVLLANPVMAHTQTTSGQGPFIGLATGFP